LVWLEELVVGVRVSVVLPAYNEADNLAELVPELIGCLTSAELSHEIIVVDDGSNDSTAAVLTHLRAEHPEVQAVRLRRNLGKSAALQLGFSRASGEIVACMDADGQDDPHEIPHLLAALDDGLDLVTGRRAERHDRFVKRQTSKAYNKATAIVTGVEGRDFNSGLKAMKAPVAASLELYGELHRYIPVLAHWAGFRTGEVPVEHHERRHGTSKFGRSRFWRGFLDLITVKFLTTYTRRPFHLFGGIGLVFALLGTGLLTYVTILKLGGSAVGQRPALSIGVLCLVVGVQMVSLGLLSELILHLRGARGPDAYADDV
jgi:glycosyltransferase involved in cell wall biosynthesis